MKAHRLAGTAGVTIEYATANLASTRIISRRRLVQAGAALGAAALASPPILTYAQGETPLKIGMTTR